MCLACGALLDALLVRTAARGWPLAGWAATSLCYLYLGVAALQLWVTRIASVRQ
jgi:hypothetical protein